MILHINVIGSVISYSQGFFMFLHLLTEMCLTKMASDFPLNYFP